MTRIADTRRMELEAAERRVLDNLRSTAPAPSSGRRLAALGVSAALFAAIFAVRLAVDDPDALIANFYVVPIALVAIEFGARPGLVASLVALGLVFAWSVVQTVHIDALGYTSRGAVLLITGVLVGHFSDRLRHDISERRRAERHLSLYADQLKGANQHLAQSVEGLEAFAQIARAVGGETDLDRVLALITAHGREIVGARALLVCLREGDQLVATTGGAPPADHKPRLPLRDSLAGQVLLTGQPRRITAADDAGEVGRLHPGASTAILVPIGFRGEMLGVLVGVDRDDGQAFGDRDEQLLLSVAASAATAVTTARSVAAERLAFSLEAAEQARGRWARELHDQTLQGLIGVRIVLSAALAREDAAAVRRAAETADAHLAAETRSLRDLITELRPAALDDLGLAPALESLAERQAAVGGFAVELQIDLGERERLAGDTEGTIYRIVQEALSNAVRHAEARQVMLRVDRRRDQIEIRVQDDGRGFDPAAQGAGFGLPGMRERALLAGGRLSVSSVAGGPTCVTALLPACDQPAAPPPRVSASSSGSYPTSTT
jgi:signal transduction histidine kinase